MIRTVDLYHQPFGRTVEIDYEPVDHMLTAELEAKHASEAHRNTVASDPL
jgi:hypothetical protein